MTVEVAMNGKHFTTNNHIFYSYVPPTVLSLSRRECDMMGGTELVIVVQESTMPASSPMIRFTSIHDPAINAIAVAEQLHDETSEGGPCSMRVITPAMDSTERVETHLEMTFNGRDYSSIYLYQEGGKEEEADDEEEGGGELDGNCSVIFHKVSRVYSYCSLKVLLIES